MQFVRVESDRQTSRLVVIIMTLTVFPRLSARLPRVSGHLALTDLVARVPWIADTRVPSLQRSSSCSK